MKGCVHTKHVWTCYCGKKCHGNGEKSRHKRACEVYKNKPNLSSAEDAKAWLNECSGCQPQVIDALVDSKIQAWLSTLEVPHSLHIHGGPKNSFISLRLAIPMNGKFVCDAVINHDNDWELLRKETAELLLGRQQQAEFYFGASPV